MAVMEYSNPNTPQCMYCNFWTGARAVAKAGRAVKCNGSEDAT